MSDVDVQGQPPASLAAPEGEAWFGPSVRGIGAASLLADLGHEVPTALLPSFLTSTLGAPAAALGLIEGVADGLAGRSRSTSPSYAWSRLRSRRCLTITRRPPSGCS